ncbi:hypothetical protein [Actinopolyspora halophila]|uniref:hypothetical protein n=1 Tax=Actinopolyspora halophila TaxID=1850 RepID=UPI000380E6B9|nr:hypothetical protein [Actinopolyspora halophila]
MTESADAERQLSQTMSAALSVALNVAVQAHQRIAEQARKAAFEREEYQRQLGRRLAAERETAAVGWSRVADREWLRTRPDEVAEAWASAAVWEPYDPRAAEARAKLEFAVDAVYGAEHPLVHTARESGDHEALAHLLNRAVETAPEQPVRYYESVPDDQRREWLQQQVWGPDVDEQTRIARSGELAAVEQGLPVAVLREMDETTRQAWIELGEQTPEEREQWQREWLQRDLWGPEAQHLTDEELQHRQQLLEHLENGETAPMTGPAWQAWLDTYQQQATETGQAEQTVAAPERAAAAPSPDGAAAGPRAETEAEQQQRAAEAVRQAWPDQVAEQVTSRDAFAALTHRLVQLEQRGYPMDESLGMVPNQRLVGTDQRGNPVRNPAALGEWHLEQLVNTVPDRGQQTEGLGRLEQYVAAHASSRPSSTTNTSASSPPSTASEQNEQPAHRGAYDTSPDAGVRLAGQSQPTPVETALGQHQQRGAGGTSAGSRSTHRPQQQERGR